MSTSELTTNHQAGAGRFVGPSVFFISFAAYLATLAPTVTFWDSGELITGAFSLGLPHPPAYPVFCMLGRLFCVLPLGSVAYRVNLLSAFFGAAAVYLLFRLMEGLGRGSRAAAPLAAAAALSFASYSQFWAVSVITEVYTLNAFALLAALYALMLYDAGGEARHLYLAAFLTGAAYVVHQSAAFSFPPLLAYLLLRRKNYRRPVTIMTALFFFALAYSAVLYLPVRASAGPLINIGSPTNPADLAWAMKWAGHIVVLKAIAGKVPLVLRGWHVAVFALFAAALAAYAYAFRRRGFTLTVSALALVNFIGIFLLEWGDISARKWGLQSKFFVPAVMFAVPVGYQAALGVMSSGRAARAAAAALLLLAVGEAALNCKACDNSRNYFAYDFAHNTLKSVRPDGALFAEGDNGIFPAWYSQGVERYRDDVFLVHTELLTYRWYMDRIQGGALRKYGIQIMPVTRLTVLEKNMPFYRMALERVAPTYFDYSAMKFLGVKPESLAAQGLVHLSPSWTPAPMSRIWDGYVLRGAADDSTNKAFAAEGVLDIYAWESVLWANMAYREGNLRESLKAYRLALDLGMKDDYVDNWAEEVEKQLKERGR